MTLLLFARHSLLALGLAASASAQLIGISSFTGASSEGFESVQTCCSVTCVTPGGLFGGSTEMCSTGVGSMGGSTGFNVGACSMQPLAGGRMAHSFEAHPEFEFELGTIRVGGYVRPILGGRTVRMTAYDLVGGQIGVHTVSLPGCSWTWIGVETLGEPIHRLRLQYSFADDYYIAYDEWQADMLPPAIYNYCAATPNSTGGPATMSGLGSASVSSNDLILKAGPAPLGSVGLFVTGSAQGQVPLGNGNLCVSGQIIRLGPVLAVTGSGQLLSSFDNTSHLASPFAAGDTLNFQAWFRDVAGGGSLFNLSDGLAVTFTP